MEMPLLSTKLHIPPQRHKTVLRSRLIDRLNEGLHHKLTLVAAPAGFGKTTLISEWLNRCERPTAWLSLDENDADPARFLLYVCAALQSIEVNIEAGILRTLRSPEPPAMEAILTILLNQITASPTPSMLVLDDYHSAQSKTIDQIISFLLEHLPPQLHLVITTRQQPAFSLARLRARGQLTELRAHDLRFTYKETDAFLGQAMGFTLSRDDTALLEARTEGWIAGLQLAALSIKGREDVSSFIQSFRGNHHFVADYLLEEVLKRQPPHVQTFLLRTSILDRMCGPLCDALLHSVAGEQNEAFASGQETLEYLEHANLFLVPLDNERRWYRYHHLFADLLRHRLNHSLQSSTGDEGRSVVVADLHIRASEWYEDKGLALEAFQHATLAGDTGRAACLAEGEGMSLLFRGEVVPVLKWLRGLSKEELDQHPALWVMYASASLMVGQMNEVERMLKAAEHALRDSKQDKKRDLIGHIAAIRATQAVAGHQAEMIMVEARRALTYLDQDNLPVRAATVWALGYVHQLKGKRIAAKNAYTKALAISQNLGHTIITMMATLGLAYLQEAENQLYSAAETYHTVLKLAGNPPLPAACEAHLGLARIQYEWNDLEAALLHGQQALHLAEQFTHTDRVIACKVFLAKWKLTVSEVSGAAAILSEADQLASQFLFERQRPHIAAVQVLVSLQQGDFAIAYHLAQKHELPISQARVLLAKGETSAALEVLEFVRKSVEEKLLEDERLQVMVILALTLHAHGEKHKGADRLIDALAMAEQGGFVRTFVNAGTPMINLLSEVAVSERASDYLTKVLAACKAAWKSEDKAEKHTFKPVHSLIEPLSARELEILRLIAEGCSNHEISERLFLALSTVKGYNRNLFDKLQVKRRTEAVARARQLGLL